MPYVNFHRWVHRAICLFAQTCEHVTHPDMDTHTPYNPFLLSLCHNCDGCQNLVRGLTAKLVQTDRGSNAANVNVGISTFPLVCAAMNCIFLYYFHVFCCIVSKRLCGNWQRTILWLKPKQTRWSGRVFNFVFASVYCLARLCLVVTDVLLGRKWIGCADKSRGTHEYRLFFSPENIMVNLYIKKKS